MIKLSMKPFGGYNRLKGTEERKVVPRKICRPDKWEDGLVKDTYPLFGPAFKTDSDSFEMAKEEAWRQVMTKTGDGEESAIRRLYLSAIKQIENEARESYASDVIKDMRKSEFQMTMMIDGCFFLQLALHILGGGELLGYPEKHPYFGSNVDETAINMMIEAMFLVGNQIPNVVIRTLLKQRFFETVIEEGIKRGIWPCLPTDLPEMVLYLLVLEPELKTRGKNIKPPGFFSRWIMGNKLVPRLRENPCDLLHALHCLVEGPGNETLDSDAEDVLDIEIDTLDFDVDALDIESGGIDVGVGAGAGAKSKRRSRFLSATELQQKGIGLAKAEEGIRNIHFKTTFPFFRSYLYVPPFTFDEHTEPILSSLQKYESLQIKESLKNPKDIGNNKREVNEYVRFMADLIQTQKDVKILNNNGIIEVERWEHMARLPGILRRVASSSEGVDFTTNLRLTKAAIEDYKPLPKHLISVGFIIAVLQTVLAILQYLFPRGPS